MITLSLLLSRHYGEGRFNKKVREILGEGK
jgi:hypothetical protein